MIYLKTFNEMADYHNSSGDKFWGNTGAGVLPICTKTGRILLPFRSKYVNEPRTYGIWGGKLDEEEGQSENEIEDVVKREFMEEGGFDGDIKLIPAFIFRTPNESFIYYNFIGLLDHEHNPTLDWETESFKWVTFNELMSIKPKHFGLQKLLNDPKSLEIIKKYSR